MYCETILNFLNGVKTTALNFAIENGRDADLSLSTTGFELLNHHSLVTNWDDEEEVRTIHYAEIRELAKEITGCNWVLFFPALIRDPKKAEASEDFNPIQLVHSDYTENYPSIIRDEHHPYHRIALEYAADEGITSQEIVASTRILTLQFWRNIGEPIVDFPICFGDRRTFKRSDLTPVPVPEYGGVRTEFESFLVNPPGEKHYRFYTFPQLTHDEIILFRAFDSELADKGEAYWTPHSAFRDPNAPEGAHRKSIEMRAICLWK